MVDYKQLFKTTDNQNWLKVVNAIHITKAGLSDFVTDAAVQLRDKITNDIQQGTNLPAGTRCNKCSTCPEANCGKFRQMIKTYHRFQGPSWRNTNPNDWCTNPWEVAKCFFPGDGYRDKVNTQETDFNGIVGFILNSTTFDGQTGENLSDIKGNKFSKCRQFVNIVRHSATLEVKDADRIDYITQLKDVLKSGSVLQNDKKADEAHGQLSLLEKDKLTITTEDIVKVIEDTLEETKQIISKANEVNKEASNINTNTRDLQTKLETLNDIYKHAVEDIEKQKQDAIKELKHTGEHVTKAAREKLKNAGRMEARHVKQTGQMVKQDFKRTGKHVTKAATEKLKIAGRMEARHVKQTGQMVKQDLKRTSEHVTKAATEKLKIAGRMETRHVKQTGQMVKQALKEEKEKVVADARDEMTEEACGIIRDFRTEDMGMNLNGTADEIYTKRKHDVKHAGENTTKAAIQKIKTAGQMEETRLEEAGRMVKQDAERDLEVVSSKIKSDLKEAGAVCFDVKQELQQQRNKTINALQEEKEKVVADARNEMTEEAYGIIRATKSEVMSTQQNKTEDEIYEERKCELRHALAHHYLTEYDSMPLSPLMPEVDDKLIKFYMAPKMNKVDTKSVHTTESVRSYESMFYNGNNSHKNIYIQGEAGIGKSTFCTKIGLVWSEKNLTECSEKDSINNEESKDFSDETKIHQFDFVFSLALRNVEGECEIETMIEKEIINGLPNHIKYAGLVPKVLDKECCLIILDGLDEWLHKRDVCKKSGQVPHRKSWSNTTVLTSTRPWKMNEVHLRDSEISTLIQVTGITDSETFIENVLNCLNDKYNTTVDVEDFLTCMEDKQLEHFLDTPVVAMQLLWLWHSDHELGDSKCQIYINMLDMLFGRADKKAPSACDDITDSSKEGLPPCFESTDFCEQHKVVLDWLASLAFHTLHSSKREETLVFSESMVKSHVKSIAARKTALTTGILSQHKSPSRNKRTSHFSFLHKTFQEFLAAYYIATHVDESENIVQTLFQVYGQTVDIMDISELFIFVCGLNTEMSCKISDSVMKSFSVKLTNHIEELHVSGGDYNVADMTESLQKMILAGYKESISNGHQDPQLALHHVHYRNISGDDQDKLVHRNKDKIVTLSAAGTWEETCTVDVVKIQQILTQSSSTLSHVSLEIVKGLTDASLDLFTNITLKSLYLDSIYTLFDIKLNTSSLLYCHLGWINKEVEHSVLSALTTAPKLHTLEVRYCKNMSVLCQVLPTLPMLHRLDVREDMIPASLCQVMSTLSQLQTLTVRGERGCEDLSLLCQLPSTLSNLQYIQLGGLVDIDLGDNDILLPNSIQEIELLMVKLTCRSFRQLVDRLTQIPHEVTCRLYYCTVRPEEEWDAIVKHIQQSHMFEIHENYIISFERITLHFTKI